MAVSAAQAPNTGGAQYFTPGTGLLALDLANDVMRWLDCGYDNTTERFWTYDDGVWRPNSGRIEQEIAHLLGNHYRTSHTRHVLDLIRFSEDAARITCAPLSQYINVPNGMVDWETGELHAHSADYRSTIQLPVEYDPDATCPKVERFLEEILPPDCIEFIWEVIGYTMYSGNPLHAAVLLYGKGRNGKGTLIRLLKALIGERNCSAVGLHELTENRFRTATLYGKLANLAGDLDSRWIANTAAFKAITGGDLIQAEYKYGATFDFTPWALPVYSANKAFGSADSSEGWVSRWTVVPFPNTFAGKEHRDLDAELHTAAELRGVMARGIRALPMLLKRGQFLEPDSVKDAKAAFVSASDTVRGWINEQCTLDPKGWESRVDLHNAYLVHPLSQGTKRLSAREFYNRLEQVNGIVATKRQGARGFKGITLGSTTEQPAPATAPGAVVRIHRSAQ